MASGGPAEKAGLRGGARVARVGNQRLPLGGDVITATDGKQIKTTDDLTVYLDSEKRPGNVSKLDVVRDGQPLSVEVTLRERPMDEIDR